MTDPVPAAPPAANGGNGKRRRALVVFLLLVLCAAGGWTWHYLAVGRHRAWTDNAYVGGNLVPISAQVAGTVLAVGADETDRVAAGQILVRLDPADFLVSVQLAEADLAATVRQVRQQFAEADRQEALCAAGEVALKRAETDRVRRENLGGALSEEEARHARETELAAQSNLAAIRASLAAARAQVEGTTLDDHPQVRRAAAGLRAALLAQERATVTAPVAGQVAKRSVQVGMRVQPGAALMAVVPLDQVWVDANFKEGQLADLRLGQAVELRADAFGEEVVFHGRVLGLGAGTGAAFALLPPQNASGNWIKIVQRLPVRIGLDPAELKEHPLRIGLSMSVAVDIRDRSGSSLTSAPRVGEAYRSAAAGGLPASAEARIIAIIDANRGYFGPDHLPVAPAAKP